MRISIRKDPLIKLYKDEIIDLPVVARVTKFDEESARRFTDDVNKAADTGQPVVPVVIDSFGGHIYSLMCMIDVVRACPKPVATIIEGKAMSCGAFLASFGRKGMRYAAPSSTIMIHEVSSGHSGKVSDVKADADETERLNRSLLEAMADNCDRKRDYFTNIIHDKNHADWYLTPAQAKEHGMIDHVGTPTLSVEIIVSMKFS